ncbi:MAG: GTPase HflX [Firmicutes bacterium]|nr:GTPase HflX [Bacillota bacterium]
MPHIFDNNQEREKLIIIAADAGDASPRNPAGGAEKNLDELALLVQTSGAEVAGRLIQKREKAHPGHYLGKGKMDELKDLILQTGADGVVADDELSAAQLRQMAQMLDVRIMDRTMVILDIFAKRAITAEGKAQVETAQLRYRLSRLAGLGLSLSRQGGGARGPGGGIGSRGPGEKKLETDRRHIRGRLDQLSAELREISAQRKVLRENRVKTGLPVISMVGYTNAGKSTLMNALTDAGVLVEDKLFATLDTTTRKAVLPGANGTEVLFTDTVGFINKLPHHLIQAFRATLEELEGADILLHVVDASNPEREAQMKVVEQTLERLGYGQKPVITVFNKCDLDVQTPLPQEPNAVRAVSVSAVTGEGLTELGLAAEDVIKSMRGKIAVLVPYSEGRLISLIHERCDITAEEHRENGTYIEAFADEEIRGKVKRYEAGA